MKYIAKPLSKEIADISRGHFSWSDILKGTASATAVLALLYLLAFGTAHLVAIAIPDSVEKNWLSKPYNYIFENDIIVAEDKQLARSQEIFNTLLANNNDLRELNYRLYLIEVPQMNAFAIPGGGIGITRELLNKVTTDAGLAFVLAHELGHHNKRHTLKSFWWAIFWNMAQTLAGVSSADAQEILIFTNSNYSRAFEQEADLYAAQQVYALYGNQKENATELFTVMLAENDSMIDSSLFAWISTHPSTSERIQYIHEEFQRLHEGQ